MNTSNPFQIPSCLQRAVQQRRQERFRRGVVAAVLAMVALLVILLIEGCVSEHAKTSADAAGQPEAALVSATTVEPKPALTIPARPVASPAIVPSTAVKVSPTEFIYTVKPSDTLIRIARQHHTTVKNIKAMNSLDSDMIAVGAKLKLPSA